VTLFSVEPGREKRAHEVCGEAWAYDLRAEAEDVHVVVLDPLVRGVDVVADRCPDAGDLGRGDRGAHARAADEHTSFRLAVLERGAELGRLVGVVDPHRVRVGTEVDDLVPFIAEGVENRVAEMDSTMVERNRHLHARDRT